MKLKGQKRPFGTDVKDNNAITIECFLEMTHTLTVLMFICNLLSFIEEVNLYVVNSTLLEQFVDWLKDSQYKFNSISAIFGMMLITTKKSCNSFFFNKPRLQ